MTMPRSFGIDPDEKKELEPKDGEKKTEKKQKNGNTNRNRTRKAILLTLIIVPIIVAIIYSLFQKQGIMWLFEIKTTFPDVDLKDDIAIILAPLTALALAIERIIETVFDLIEQSIGSMARLIGESRDAVKWVEEEYSNASNEVKKGVQKLGALRKDNPDGSPPPSEEEIKKAENKLKQAEERLTEAGERLSSMTSDPIYVQMKRALSIMIGLFLGFVVAIFSDQGIFAYLQQGVPRIVDIFVTGFIIGAGSGPMHSLIGILQGFKDALENFGKGTLKSLQAQVDEIKGEINQ